MIGPPGLRSRWARHACGLKRAGQRECSPRPARPRPSAPSSTAASPRRAAPEPAERVADHQRHAAASHASPHPLAGLERVRDRLLDEDVPPALGARERLLLVHVVGRGEHHALHARMLDRLLEARRRLAAEALGELAAPAPRSRLKQVTTSSPARPARPRRGAAPTCPCRRPRPPVIRAAREASPPPPAASCTARSRNRGCRPRAAGTRPSAPRGLPAPSAPTGSAGRACPVIAR